MDPTSYRVGDATVTRIPECSFALPAARLLPDWDPAFVTPDHEWLVPDHMDAERTHLTVSVHSWLLRTAGRTILIDTGIGNGKSRSSPLFNQRENPYLQRLAAAGVTPQQVTHVLLTHIHTDHVGWNTISDGDRWVPTFPNARYFIPLAGQTYFSAPDGHTKSNYDMYADSVLPIIQAGLAHMVEPAGGEALDGFTWHPTPGHSVDHMTILLRSADQQAMFAGDVMHHPVQLRRPDWNSVFCADPGSARASRAWALEQASAEPMLYFSSHFAGTSAGRIRRDGSSYQWCPA